MGSGLPALCLVLLRDNVAFFACAVRVKSILVCVSCDGCWLPVADKRMVPSCVVYLPIARVYRGPVVECLGWVSVTASLLYETLLSALIATGGTTINRMGCTSGGVGEWGDYLDRLRNVFFLFMKSRGRFVSQTLTPTRTVPPICRQALYPREGLWGMSYRPRTTAVAMYDGFESGLLLACPCRGHRNGHSRL